MDSSGTNRMDPTPSEKLILVMLSEIYQHLGIQGEVDAIKVRAAISTGNVWSLPKFENEELSDTDVNFVNSVLAMWKHIEESIAALSDQDREALPSGYPGGWDNRSFPSFGFSPRGGRCLNIAEHMIQNLGQWSYFSNYELRPYYDDIHDLDKRYDHMLSVYPLTGGIMFGKPMNLRAITELLTAFDKSVGPKMHWVEYDEPDYDITDV